MGESVEKPRYIAVEGPIAVGKTSLAHRLCNIFNARLVLEDAEKNPFLEDFYKDRGRYAFQTQIYFLLNRYKQQLELSQLELFKQDVITDFLFSKDRIFASVNLKGHELELYEQIYRILDLRIPKPDLVIYLQATPDVLLSRIKKRKKTYEKPITLEYLEEITAAYNEFFFHYNETPLLVINTSNIDFVEKEEDFKRLVKEIKSIRQGIHYFNPLGS